MTEMNIYPKSEDMARAAGEYMVRISRQAIAVRGTFTLALAGGSTPRVLYGLLATEPFRSQIDWFSTRVFWGDERCVPPEHPDSNYRMAREVLLDHVPIPPGHIHRMRGELEPGEAANDYERTLRAACIRHPVSEVAGFDTVLLGMGDDGHTASLFPGTQALKEQNRRVVANFVDTAGVWRITLTAACINTAAHIIFLVAGTNKAETLRQVLHGPFQPELLPAQLIKPVQGRLLWLVDSEAASQLP